MPTSQIISVKKKATEKHMADTPVCRGNVTEIPWFLLLMLLLAACAVADPILYSDAFDTNGNRLPIACLDVSDVRVSVVLLSHKEMQARLHDKGAGWSLLGLWHPPDNPKISDGTIYLDRELEPALFYEAMRHEMCHAKMFKMRGDPNWHPD